MLSTMIWYNIYIAKDYRLYFEKIDNIWANLSWWYLGIFDVLAFLHLPADKCFSGCQCTAQLHPQCIARNKKQKTNTNCPKTKKYKHKLPENKKIQIQPQSPIKKSKLKYNTSTTVMRHLNYKIKSYIHHKFGISKKHRINTRKCLKLA